MESLRALIEALPEDLRRHAFTHASWVEDRADSYERLEFLGDGVLGLAVAEELYRRYPEGEEGKLARLRAHVVSRRSCAVVARVLDLGALFDETRVARGADAAGLETNRNVLAALCESGIGACFLTYGYARTARAVVVDFEERITYAADEYVDHKTELQEELARQGSSVSYVLVEQTGPPHRRRFTTQAVVDGVAVGSGSGYSKKASEQAAAREALALYARAEEPPCT